MAGSRNDWFPSSIWRFKLDNSQQINQQLLTFISEDKTQDSTNIQSANLLLWDNIDNLQRQLSFSKFSIIVQKNVIEVASFLNWDLNKFKIEITHCWANIHQKHAYTSVQSYYNSLLSGIYFLKAPVNSGGIYFNDPRPALNAIAPPLNDLNMWTLPKITYKPYEGVMLLFPSWLSHGMERNLSDEDRTYISFELGLFPIIE
ncbi:hypothetical protein NIES4101_40820 [Calothrix sp. NIES-4101]|nr:hypothetical protein NIES4101_40820 [Calothrix sp. NIES-4101]